MKKLFLILFLVTFLFSDIYDIKYKGITLGKIDSLSTLKDDYLKARVTNSIVKFIMRKDFFIFYAGKKPNFPKTKYKKDSKKIIYALKRTIEAKPYDETFIIDDKRKINIKCFQKNLCTFDYFSKGEHSASGIIEFKNGKFYKLYEKKSSLEIIKDEKGDK